MTLAKEIMERIERQFREKSWTSIPYILLNHHIKTNVPFELGLDKSKFNKTPMLII
jgi:hypothetical protein